jgi:thiol:disulfide interchange protein DsbA
MNRQLLTALAALILAACSQTATTPAASSAADSAAAPATSPAAGAPAAGAANVVPAGESVDAATGSGQSTLERAVTLPAAGNLPATAWVAGKNYRVLSPAQPTSVSPGKVEAVEVFWYGCSHCFAFEPLLESWAKKLPANVEFVRVPLIDGSQVHMAHARLYYTLQALGKVDALQAKVFNEIHLKGNLLAGANDAESLKLQQAFAKANGISESDYADAYNSFTVQTRMQQGEDLMLRYKVDGVPSMVINGKYVSDAAMSTSHEKLLSLSSDLLAAESRR